MNHTPDRSHQVQSAPPADADAAPRAGEAGGAGESVVVHRALWTLDRGAGTALHACGLLVQFEVALPGGRALNFDTTIQALTAEHGHRASAVAARLMREAAELMRAALADEPAPGALARGLLQRSGRAQRPTP